MKQRVYNLREKQMMKILSRAFDGPYSEMIADLEKGDMPGSAKKVFIILYYNIIQQSITDRNWFSQFWLQSGKAAKRSTLTLKHVNDFLDQLTKLTKEDEQTDHFKKFLPKCTGGLIDGLNTIPSLFKLLFYTCVDDLKWVCKVIDHDLKINIGAKFVLGALHPDAFEGTFI